MQSTSRAKLQGENLQDSSQIRWAPGLDVGRHASSRRAEESPRKWNMYKRVQEELHVSDPGVASKYCQLSAKGYCDEARYGRSTMRSSTPIVATSWAPMG